MSDIDFTNFSSSRMLTVSKRVLRQITRDRRTFGMIIFMPLLIMLVFGIALSGEIKNIAIVVENQDTDTSEAAGIVIKNALDSDTRVSLKEGTYSSAINEIEDGKLSAAILIPADFTTNLQQKAAGGPDVTLEIRIYIDGTDPLIRANIMAALQDVLSDALGDQGVQFDETLAHDGAEQSGLDVAIPAVMGFVLTFLVLLLSSLTMVRERIGGTQYRLYTTPLNKMELLSGYVLALTFFGFIEVVSILTISVFLFGATVAGNFTLLMLAAFMYAIVHVLLAVFLSNFAENELQAMQMVPIIALPSMALSGMLVPVDSLPVVAQNISNFVPLTYGIRLFEGIMLKGFDLGNLWLDFLKLGVFLLVFFVLSVLTVKDHNES